MYFVQHSTDFLDLRIQRTVKGIMGIFQSLYIAFTLREILSCCDSLQCFLRRNTSKYALCCQNGCCFLRRSKLHEIPSQILLVGKCADCDRSQSTNGITSLCILRMRDGCNSPVEAGLACCMGLHHGCDEPGTHRHHSTLLILKYRCIVDVCSL